MRQKILGLLSLLLFPFLAAADETAHLWERAAYGSLSGISQVTLSGNNGAITTTFEPAWPESAAYTVLAVDMSSPYIASSSTNDDGNPVGTGARTARVDCVSAAGVASSATYTLDGQTSVSLTQTCMVINKVEVLTVGSGGVNAGVIRVGTGSNTSGVPAVVHAHVAVGTNVSDQFIYMVPDNKSLLCRNFTAGSLFTTAAAAHRFVLDVYQSAVLKRSELVSGETGGANPFTLPILKKFSEKSVIVGQALGATSTGPATLSAECLLIDDIPDQLIF
jgi:hypothetical protein